MRTRRGCPVDDATSGRTDRTFPLSLSPVIAMPAAPGAGAYCVRAIRREGVRTVDGEGVYVSSQSPTEANAVSRRMWSRIIAISLVLVMVFSAFLILGTPARASPPTILPRAVPDYMKFVTINNLKFDPLASTPSIPDGLRYDTIPRDQPFYYIVQFNGPVTSAMKAKLASTGVTILQYLAYNAFVVSADGPAIDRASALPIVRWTGVFEPAYKLSPRLSDDFAAIAQRAMERERYGDSLDGSAVTVIGGGIPSKTVNVAGGAAMAG